MEYKPSPIMRWFSYTHLPVHLQDVSMPFMKLADKIDSSLPNSPEKSVALRKLLEGKDAAVRAALEVYENPPTAANPNLPTVREEKQLPHSRACGFFPHPHGIQCDRNCPTCGGGLPPLVQDGSPID